MHSDCTVFRFQSAKSRTRPMTHLVIPDSACGASGMTKVRHRRRAGCWTLKAKNSAIGVQLSLSRRERAARSGVRKQPASSARRVRVGWRPSETDDPHPPRKNLRYAPVRGAPFSHREKEKTVQLECNCASITTRRADVCWVSPLSERTFGGVYDLPELWGQKRTTKGGKALSQREVSPRNTGIRTPHPSPAPPRAADEA